MKLDREDEAINEILQLALTLPYLPSKNWFDVVNGRGAIVRGGLTILKEKINGVRPFNEKLLDFMTYIENFLGPLADIVSVNGRPRKTSNVCENGNRRAKAAIGVRQTLWAMLGKKIQFYLSLYFLIILYKFQRN